MDLLVYVVFRVRELLASRGIEVILASEVYLVRKVIEVFLDSLVSQLKVQSERRALLDIPVGLAQEDRQDLRVPKESWVNRDWDTKASLDLREFKGHRAGQVDLAGQQSRKEPYLVQEESKDQRETLVILGGTVSLDKRAILDLKEIEDLVILDPKVCLVSTLFTPSPKELNNHFMN